MFVYKVVALTVGWTGLGSRGGLDNWRMGGISDKPIEPYGNVTYGFKTTWNCALDIKEIGIWPKFDSQSSTEIYRNAQITSPISHHLKRFFFIIPYIFFLYFNGLIMLGEHYLRLSKHRNKHQPIANKI